MTDKQCAIEPKTGPESTLGDFYAENVCQVGPPLNVDARGNTAHLAKSRVETSEIIAAYRETGSVWKAGALLGISGQTVSSRLRAVGHSSASRWTTDEVDELRRMVGESTIGQIADTLGRSYASIACKINEIGVGVRYGNSRPLKPERGTGLDKVSVRRHIKAIEKSDIPITRYSKQVGMKNVDTLIRAIEYHFPDWWTEYRKSISYLPESECPECGSRFHPSNSRQQFCCRRCSERNRVDRTYFGGKRKLTIGWAEGVCQICGRKPKSHLSSHHVLGKQNDPNNEYLVALCRGCHDLVTSLGGRDFNSQQWESLITFAWMRNHGAVISNHPVTVDVCVEMEITYEDEEESA